MAIRTNPRLLATHRWKIEHWLTDVFPGSERVYEEYQLLPERELAVVACAVLDVALCELIAARTGNTPNESAEFIGADENGRAPAGSFGARIQLAVILGIISEHDARVLRALKNVRNLMAHRVRVSFRHSRAQKRLSELLDAWKALMLRLENDQIGTADARHGLEQIRRLLPSAPEAGQGLLLAVLSVYQAYFHRILERGVMPIGSIASRPIIK